MYYIEIKCLGLCLEFLFNFNLDIGGYILEREITFNISIDDTIAFWKDTWRDVIPLKVLFLRAYEICMYKQGTIAEFWSRKKWRLRSDPRAGWHTLLNILQQIWINNNDDFPVWKWKKSDFFSVKTMYDFINDKGVRSKHAAHIWKTKCPLKLKIFLWLLDMNVILTRNNLQQRGWQGPSRCILCGTATEIVTHFMAECTYTKMIWMEVAHQPDIQFRMD